MNNLNVSNTVGDVPATSQTSAAVSTDVEITVK